MFAYLMRRLTSFGATLIAASLVIFVVLEVLPGDPALLMLGAEARPDTLAALRAQMGLDDPAWVRYPRWVAGLLGGDFGISYTYAMPVGDLIADRLSVTIPLALFAIILSTVVAIPLGVVAAARHNRLGDYGVMAFAQIGVAIPNFWLGILLILFFSVFLGWFASGGFPGWGDGPGPALKALLLPAVALGLSEAAILARVTRSAILDTAREDYARTARAKGLGPAAVLWRHVLRNAMIPVLTIMGLQFSFLAAGAIVIENVFYLPGLGRLIFQAIAQRDLIVVQNVVVLLSALVLLVNFAVDLLQAVVDPRARAVS